MSRVEFKDIVAYWQKKEDESGLAVDWSEAHERCWRCAYKARLEKCHIIPDSLGGTATPDNFVLLCGRCHREAPNHANPRYMWVWLRATCLPFNDMYWTNRGQEEFETMFGRTPLDWADALDLDAGALQAEFNTLLRTEFSRAVIHFGEGRMNPSTIACVLAEVELQLAAQHDVAITNSEAGYAGARFIRKMLGQTDTP
ncbi:HNH endonuclease [Lentzea tibetensis]|uniref:HNH endonuclease n=1 Tax=Lentzea tibetensis TaxID=2591470 RepID=UPI00164956DF|nr:HNH endonuclease signature motif containing protein [Lentzea tibetensis]